MIPTSNLGAMLLQTARRLPDRPGLVWRDRVWSWAEIAARACSAAAGLRARGIGAGDRVLIHSRNNNAIFEGVWACWLIGAVWVPTNFRLSPPEAAYLAGSSRCKAQIFDVAFPEHRAACRAENPACVLDIAIGDGAGFSWEDLIAEGNAAPLSVAADVDRDHPAWFFYTSGTTGRPKGVVYHHRGAYLNAMGQVISWRMTLHPRYLTIVPLFHCNGWCHTWMMPVLGGTLICCRDITAPAIFDAIADEGVTHFGGAPIVLNTLVNAPASQRRDFPQTVEVFTAGAPVAPATLAKIEPMGFNVTQVYGLTETYGPGTECTWNAAWDDLQGDDRAAMKARQGVAMPFLEDVTVMTDTMHQIPMDGVTQGEIMFRGNGVMKGYLKNPKATEEAFRGGWFHSGDIAVQHPNGYMQIADRAKDIIISGGENISSVEVEGVLMAHPDVLLCAVVAKPDEKWGEVPCAFVELKDGVTGDEAALIAFARQKLAGFKTPKHVVFQELPKTSTGKIQKFELRAIAKGM